MWTVLSKTPTPCVNAYTNQLIGRSTSARAARLGRATYLRSSVVFTGQDTFVTELVRLVACTGSTRSSSSR